MRRLTAPRRSARGQTKAAAPATTKAADRRRRDEEGRTGCEGCAGPKKDDAGDDDEPKPKAKSAAKKADAKKKDAGEDE